MFALTAKGRKPDEAAASSVLLTGCASMRQPGRATIVSLPPDHPQLHLALPDPPENLRHLSAADWLLLDNLLARELNLKEHSPVH